MTTAHAIITAALILSVAIVLAATIVAAMFVQQGRARADAALNAPDAPSGPVPHWRGGRPERFDS